MKPEEILENQIKELKTNFFTKEKSLGMAKNSHGELTGIIQSLLALPKNEAPLPSLQRKYILAQEFPSRKPAFFASFLHVSRFAAGSVALSLLLALLSLGGVKAWTSLPGQPLFQVKRTAENVRLKFVMDNTTKAKLQLEITQKRFSEAQIVLNNPNTSQKDEVAALNELASQTKSAAESVQKLTQNQPLEENSHPIITELEDIVKKQADIIEKSTQKNSEVLAAANQALENSTQAVTTTKEIKKYIAIASAKSDSALTDLNQKTESYTGTLLRAEKDYLLVDKKEFQINENTKIQSQEGKEANLQSLALKSKVEVKYINTDNISVAINISPSTSSPTELPGKVKGENTSSTPSSTLPTLHSTTPSTILPDPEPVPEKPQLGSFLIENPNPEFNQP